MQQQWRRGTIQSPHALNEMLYIDLFKSLERARWSMETDIPWDQFDARKLTNEQALTIKMNAITEWAALPATEMFLRDFV
ncbi:MAG: hypothetical protein Q8M46_00960, partial [Thiobacillus sp.]|nr:hypothetical protein [Thiobacillus sp.]